MNAEELTREIDRQNRIMWWALNAEDYARTVSETSKGTQS